MSNELASKRFVGLVVIGQLTSMPGPDVRAIFERLARQATSMEYLAFAVEGEGFRAAATRAMITGLSLMSRKRVAKTFSSVDEAVGWLQASAPELAGVSSLQAAIATMRRAVAEAT